MGYAQYIEMEVYNKSKKRTYKIDGSNLAWGKFYERPDKNKEIGTGSVNGQVIEPKTGIFVSSCGRQDTSSGTEGSFTIYEGNIAIGTVHWDNPWVAGSTNRVWVANKNEDYAVEVGEYDAKNASIGYVKVSVSYTD